MTIGTYLKQYIDQIPQMIPTSLAQLGAGSLATLNSLDLGTSLATGTLPYSKLPDSGVAAGTYALASLTINAKGIVTGVLANTITFPVTTVFGRTGAVTAQANDYSIGQIFGAGALAGLATLDLSSTYAIGRVTYGKMPQVTAGKLIGNPTGSAADAQEIALGAGLAFAGAALVASANAPTATVSASLTLDATYRTIFVDASAGPVTLTLPDPVSFKNTAYTVKKVDATYNAVTLAGTVDGRANYSTTTPNDFATVQAAGSAGWQIIA